MTFDVMFNAMLTACLAFAAAAASILTACDRHDQAPRQPASIESGANVRIASLSPAISRTLVDLGLERHIAGRSRFCDFLDSSIPPIGDLLEIDFETLVRVKPTHVLVQPPAAGVDQHLVDLCSREGWRLATWRIDSIDEIEAMVRELPDVLFSAGTADHTRAMSRSADLLNSMALSLSPRGERVFTGRTLLVHHIDPVGVSGRDTYLHELLARLGGTNAVDARGWVEFSLEDITRLNPDAIIIVSPGASAATDAKAAAGALATMPIDAVRSKRMALLRHRDALTPCTAVAAVADELRGILVKFANPAGAGASERQP